ncbi:MAG: hydrolase [Ruminococcus sp.]|nr:hydrolase [Ruminococcus sp.]
MTDARKLMDSFITIYKNYITRPGSDRLLNYLLSENSDFFVAPASADAHGNYEGGLCEHSINVYECLRAYCYRDRVRDTYGLTVSDESIAVVGLLHDICKVNVYEAAFRNVRNERGQTEQVPYYICNDALPYGHGEKSVYLISQFMRLTREEAFAIRWHMGFSGSEDRETVRRALGMFPLALAVHIADMEAAFLLEGGNF